MLNYKVMVVDDDEIVQFTSKMILSRFVNVSVAHIFGYTNPLNALRYLQTHQNEKDMMPDLVLLDINMPMMDGFEFLEFVSETIVSNMPIIFMVSSSTYHEDIKKAKSHKLVKEYVSKPINEKELVDLIAKYKTPINI